MLWKVLLGTLALCTANHPAFAQAAGIAPDRMLVVDGKRTFVLGSYETPDDDVLLQQVADAGFNLVRVSADAAALDRVWKHGLRAWINTGAAIDLSDDRANREEQLRKMAAAYASHPALITWEVPDEALWNCWYGAIQWRNEEEPRQQAKKINALADAALAEQLRQQRKQADDLFKRGDFAAWEQLADDIWTKLGMTSPSPGLGLSNAPQRAAKMCAGMREGYALLKKLDPQHPVWMNHAPRNSIAQLAAFNEAADAVGCDIYPVPEYRVGHSDLADRSLASTGAYTVRMQEAAPSKPVWMVLQGFAWASLETNPTPESIKEKRSPTFEESRFMAYDTIVHGARGILYWGTHCEKKDGALWKDLLKLVRELADRQPLLSAPDAALKPTIKIAQTWQSLDQGICVLPKDVAGKTWFIVVNESSGFLSYALGGLDALDGTKYRDAADAREGRVADGMLILGIRGYGVQILAPES